MCQIPNTRFVCKLLTIFIIVAGCQTTNITHIPYKKENSKRINNLAILYPSEIPEMYVNVRNDEQMLSTLFAGPAIIAQIFMQASYHFARQDDKRILSDLVFDLNIGDVLCKKLNTKFQLCSFFHVVPQETIERNKSVWKLLEKKEKDIKDYQSIGVELGVDTLFEIHILSYGIKDPGFFSDPYIILKAEVKMTAASEGIVLWRDIIDVKKSVGMGTADFIDAIFTDVQVLKKGLENAADIMSERCMERLGFDTNYTYLLDKDFIEMTDHKMDIAKKLDEINTLRYENLITDIDYDGKKLDLIARAKSKKAIGPDKERTQETIEEIKQIIEVESNSGLPPLPRRD